MKIPQNIYMIGMGGIGMSALAQLFRYQGKKVSGSDRESSVVTQMLEEKGIPIRIGQKTENVPDDAELIVYSDAVGEDNPERRRAEELGITQISYFKALGEVSKSMRTIAVAGTHGKTTTTAMLAKILKDAGKEPTAVVGSIVADFGSNFLPGRGELFVVEACEYRDHILELEPEILVITNIEWDHTDFFPTFEDLQATFRKAAERVPTGGCIVTDPSNPKIASVVSHAKAPIIDYTTQSVPRLKLIGEFNIENAQAAKAAARVAFPHLQESFTDTSLMDFKGSWRRFEYKGKTASGADVYDDYAHHPTAIAKTIAAARGEFSDKSIVVAFHPHLYSRTRDLFEGFVDALSTADSVVLAPIYAAREQNTGDISSEKLAEAIRKKNPSVSAVADLQSVTAELGKYGPTDLIITMGAGDIYKVADRIAKNA